MSLILARSFTWTPLGRSVAVLDSIDLDIAAGERVLIAGASGAGKSTLLKAIAGVLEEVTPGESSGTLLVGGTPPVGGASGTVLVGQHPGEGLVAGTVGREVAFGPENLGLPADEIWERVEQALADVNFPYPCSHSTLALSGGQAQRLALASALAVRPAVLALDEPVSMLDHQSATELRSAIAESLAEPTSSAGEPGQRTLLVADHDIGAWLGMVERIIVLDRGGRIIADGPIGEVLSDREQELLDLGLWVPGCTPPTPVAVDDSLVKPLIEVPELLLSGTSLCLTRRPAQGLRVSFPREPRLVLDRVGVRVNAGEMLALRGASGSGKSTLLSALCGLLTPDSGELTWHGDEPRSSPANWTSTTLASRFGWVPQFSEATAVHNTVEDSLLATARALNLDENQARTRAVGLLRVLGLEDRLKDHPLRLSGGEQRRLAVATAVLHGPGLIVLDEPTVGLDRHTWAGVVGVMVAAGQSGAGVVVATHDEQLSSLADRVQTLPTREGVNSETRSVRPPAKVASTHLEQVHQDPVSGYQGPTGQGMRVGFLARCGPVALLSTVVIFTVAGLFSSGVVPLGIGMVVLLIVGPLVTGPGFPLVRLVPGLIGVISVMWSNWLLSSNDSVTAGVQAGLRVGFIALPAIVTVSFLDPVRFGDQFAQLLKLPARPVLALVAALQRLDDLHQRWNQLVDCRRIRGLSPGRSPIARIKHGVGLLLALLVDSVRQAGRLSIAMDTRGYATLSARKHRSWAQPAPWVGADTALILLATTLAIIPLLVSAVR